MYNIIYIFIFIDIYVHHTYIYIYIIDICSLYTSKDIIFFQPETSGWSTVNCCFPIHCPMVSTEAKPLSFTWLWSGCHNNMMREDDESLLILQSLLQSCFFLGRFWDTSTPNLTGYLEHYGMVMKLHIPQVCGMWEETSLLVFSMCCFFPKKGLLRGNDRHSTTKAFAKPNFPGTFFLME